MKGLLRCLTITIGERQECVVIRTRDELTEALDDIRQLVRRSPVGTKIELEITGIAETKFDLLSDWEGWW